MANFIRRSFFLSRRSLGQHLTIALILQSLVLGILSYRNLSPVKPTHRSQITSPTPRSTTEIVAISSMSAKTTRHIYVRSHSDKRFRSRNRISDLARIESHIESLATDLNNEINLPLDIDVSFESCDYPDVFYDHKRRQVTICYELFDDLTHLFSRHIHRRRELQEAVDNTIASVFLHEISHAFVDVLRLSITGREEDAADQFSILMLMNTSGGERKALFVASAYHILAKSQRREEPAFWDEHSLDAQRYYDTLCLIYGRDPDKYAYLARKGILPEERAELCEEDYERIENAWRTLLKPYSKTLLWARR
jgi:hypothetical protein